VLLPVTSGDPERRFQGHDIIKPPLAIAKAALRVGLFTSLFVCLSDCLSVSLSVAKLQTKNTTFSKSKQFRATVCIGSATGEPLGRC